MRRSVGGLSRKGHAVFFALLAVLMAACQTTADEAASGDAAPCDDRPPSEAIAGAGMCLAVRTHGMDTAGTSPTLVVLLHGDLSRGGPADYLLRRAEELGAQPGIVAVAMIRPGYADGLGNRSTGSHNNRRDHYTERNNRAVAEAVRALGDFHGAERTIVVGHSGGAAQTGALIGRFPDVADAALLVSCPCDVRRWRSMSGRSAWPRSESPSDFTETVSASLAVVAITGSRDDNTAPALARDYVADLEARGIDAVFVEAPGQGHGFDGLWPTVRRELDRLIAPAPAG